MARNETAVKYIRLHGGDNVAALPFGGAESTRLQGSTTILASDIRPGHKAALADIAAGEEIRKYGEVIGVAILDIPAGTWVHDHNISTTLGESPAVEATDAAGPDPASWRAAWPAAAGCPPAFGDGDVFPGYVRPNGKAGIRNELWIIPTVGCINAELRALIRDYRCPPWIDRVQILEHPYGCSQLGDDLSHTADILAALAEHPNAAGVVVAGLGCENLARDALMRKIANPLARSVVLQDEPGARLRVLLDELADQAPRERTAIPVDKLVVGVKCGGSDGFSGLTANPLLGRLSENLVYRGGTVVASEIPEMFGAEQVMLERMAGPEVRRDFLDAIAWFRRYFVEHGQPVYENPSPGNREGGISTLEEKSLGAVEKIGKAPIVGVHPYGGTVPPGQPGVHVVLGPGNDLVSSTALAAAGAQLILFTTGRGTPFGSVVPTLKISSNSDLFRRKPEWLDFDAGTLLEDGSDWCAATAALAALVLATAGGKPARNEESGNFGIAVFKNGVTL